MQVSFQAMVQKLIQRCETKVNADACKASGEDMVMKRQPSGLDKVLKTYFML